MQVLGGKKQEPYNKLPEVFYHHFDKLPVWDETEGEKIILILKMFMKGMIAELEQFESLYNHSASRARLISLFIYDKAVTDVRLEELAGHLSLSKSRTSYLVKKYFNLSFSDLINQERIKRARVLLTGTDYTISDISNRIGYKDEYYFNKVFKKHIGISPGKFRKQIKQF